jgi:putative phosphoribosyl transferase
MIFQNREEAAKLLAAKLIEYKEDHPLVLAIPRGAVPMAQRIAEVLEGDLDVVLVHKLGAPEQPEFAIGALDENGHIHLASYIESFDIPYEYIDQEKAAQLAVLKERANLYRSLKPPIDPKNRTVIIIDDGIATGETLAAALKAIKAKHPAKLIAAAAVASREAFQNLQKFADKIVCLDIPEPFGAVGQFFLEFPQVSDEEVVTILKRKK